MNKILTYLLLFMTPLYLLTSCGLPELIGNDLVKQSESAVRQFSTTDSRFNKYIEEFEEVGRTQLSNKNFEVGDIPINFGDTENEKFQGVCFEYSNGQKEIIIRKEWWKNASETYKKSLLFHELGHCRLGREHLDDTYKIDNKKLKISMMNSVIVRPTTYSEYSDEYHKELFTQDKTDLFQSWNLAVK